MSPETISMNISKKIRHERPAADSDGDSSHGVGSVPADDLVQSIWDWSGRTFKDLDGYRIVIRQTAWSI